MSEIDSAPAPVAAPVPKTTTSSGGGDQVVNGVAHDSAPVGDVATDVADVPEGGVPPEGEVPPSEVAPAAVQSKQPTDVDQSPAAAAAASSPPSKTESDLDIGTPVSNEYDYAHSIIMKNRLEPVPTGHISTESRQVMRKGFDLGISSPGLRMMYDARIKELEEELELERASRNKADRQRAELQRDLATLADRIEDSNEAARSQSEASRRRETEFLKLQRDLEESQTLNEAQLAVFRRKHQESVMQLTDQLDQLHKVKQKIEKEKIQQKAELDDLRGQLEYALKAKNSSEKQTRQTEVQLSEVNNRIAALQTDFNDLASVKNRFQLENVELLRRLEDAKNELDQTNRSKLVLVNQVDEMKLALEEQATARNKVLGDNRNLQVAVQQLREQLEDEQERRADAQRSAIKASNEASIWRQKFESGEGGIRPEELDDIKKKLSARIQDGEAQLEAALAKAIGLEKAKTRSQMDIEALMAEVEKCQAINAQLEKRQRQFDRLIDEWKRKVNDIQTELDNAQKESRSNAAEAYKFKGQLEETHEVIELLRRENKNLTEEIHDLTDQINSSNARIHEVEKVGKRFEHERDELQVTLEEAEAALEQEEARVERANADVAAIREEMERRLVEKDEEFEGVRKNNQRVLDAMQINLETETRGKSDALRAKKKLEQDIVELEMTIEAVNKTKLESEKSLKKYQQQIRDLQQHFDDEHKARQEQRDLIAASERRNVLLTGEIQELRGQIDVYEKTRKMAEGELVEAADRIAELSAANSALIAAKKKYDADFQALHSDYEERIGELRRADEQAKKAMSDAARLADELRQEQEHAVQMENVRRGLETQIKELQMRVDEAEAAALHGGRKTIQKLEQRVREVEHELETEQQKHAEAQKTLRKQDRRLQEINLQVDEDRKANDRMKDMVDKLQQKIKANKKQIDEAEEIASINLAKYRKMQHDLEEAEARAEMAESLLSQARSRRFSSVVETSAQPYPGVTIKSTTTTTRSSDLMKHEA